ncbi:MAG TPA: hypothetical protein VIK18_22380 [Pirellulales bacterium]
MNPTCKSKQENLDEVQQFWDRQRNLSPEEQIESKLAHLQGFILQLEKSTSGQAELRSRLSRFGECKREAGESTSHFYGRLRRWLDRDVKD